MPPRLIRCHDRAVLSGRLLSRSNRYCGYLLELTDQVPELLPAILLINLISIRTILDAACLVVFRGKILTVGQRCLHARWLLLLLVQVVLIVVVIQSHCGLVLLVGKICGLVVRILNSAVGDDLPRKLDNQIV